MLSIVGNSILSQEPEKRLIQLCELSLTHSNLGQSAGAVHRQGFQLYDDWGLNYSAHLIFWYLLLLCLFKSE